jgi:predicted small secreted protein
MQGVEKERCVVNSKARIFAWMVLILSCLTSLGCNTLEGMGQDIERGGEEIQEAAD